MPLNLGQRIASTAQAVAPSESDLRSAVIAIKGHYDFAVDGGGNGDHPLTVDQPIPTGAMVVEGYIDVTTQVTGGGGSTLAINVNAAGDICTAEAVATWVVDIFHVLPALTSGDQTTTTSPVKAKAYRDIVLTVAGGALTAGVFDVVLFVVLP
jgi:hypothetical protein